MVRVGLLRYGRFSGVGPALRSALSARYHAVVDVDLLALPPDDWVNCVRRFRL